MKDHCLLFEFLHCSFHLQKLTVTSRFEETAVSGYDGQAKFLLAIAENSFWSQPQKAEELFYASMAVAEIADKIDHTIRISVTKTHTNLSPVAEHNGSPPGSFIACKKFLPLEIACSLFNIQNTKKGE
jgi:hypothetical protein